MVDFLVKKARIKIHEDTKEHSQTMEWFKTDSTLVDGGLSRKKSSQKNTRRHKRIFTNNGVVLN